MNKNQVLIGTILGLITVMIGAFGAHGLKSVLLLNDKLEVFKTGVTYQMMHSLVLLMIGFGYDRLNAKWAKIAGYLFFAGILVFSGSLYLLAITNFSALGAITPFGGVMFILGWLSMLVSVYKSK